MIRSKLSQSINIVRIIRDDKIVFPIPIMLLTNYAICHSLIALPLRNYKKYCICIFTVTIEQQQQTMDMDSSSTHHQQLTGDAKSINALFELVEKLTIQLNEKDKELATNKQQNTELTANLNSVMARANQADALKTALNIATSKKKEYRQTIQAYQTIFWKSFPSPHLCYYIKIKTTIGPGLQQKYHYLYADNSGKLRSSGVQPIPSAGYFKFTKSLDGSFFVYSMAKEKYLQMNHSPYSSTAVYFTANDCRSINVKFVLTFLPQNQQPGFMVDIRSLANDNFLSGFNGSGFVMADSATPPLNKFLILPVVDGQ